MGGREVSRPYRVWFFAEGELFFMFLFQSPCIFPLNRYYHTAQKKKEGDYFFMAKPRRTPLNCLEMSPIVEREVLPLRALTV